MAVMDAEETKMLNSLTWRPLDDDVLLFALVVVAPYQTMHNFKYKVKLTPGTGKRGKAAKSAIALFEVDLLITFPHTVCEIRRYLSDNVKLLLYDCTKNETQWDIK